MMLYSTCTDNYQRTASNTKTEVSFLMSKENEVNTLHSLVSMQLG